MMDTLHDEETFEPWLRAADLADEMPWILRPSFETFQETRLMETENSQGFMPLPCTPNRKAGALQALPRNITELDSEPDAASIPQDSLHVDQDRLSSTACSAIRSVSKMFVVSDIPSSSISSLPKNLQREAEGAKTAGASLMGYANPESHYSNTLLPCGGSGSLGPCFLVPSSIPSVLRQAARILSFVPAPLQPIPPFADSRLARARLNLKSLLEEVAVGLDILTLVMPELPLGIFHPFISPGLGVKRRTTGYLSDTRVSRPQDRFLNYLYALQSNSTLEISLEGGSNVAAAPKLRICDSSRESLHMIACDAGLDVSLGTIAFPPKMTREVEISTPESTVEVETKGIMDPFVAKTCEQSNSDSERQNGDTRCVNTPLPNRGLLGEEDLSSQENQVGFKELSANSPAPTIVTEANEAAEDGVIFLSPTATQEGREISCGDSAKETAACEQRGVSKTPEPVIVHHAVRLDNLTQPIRSEEIISHKSNTLPVSASDLETGVQSSDSHGMFTHLFLVMGFSKLIRCSSLRSSDTAKECPRNDIAMRPRGQESILMRSFLSPIQSEKMPEKSIHGCHQDIERS